MNHVTLYHVDAAVDKAVAGRRLARSRSRLFECVMGFPLSTPTEVQPINKETLFHHIAIASHPLASRENLETTTTPFIFTSLPPGTEVA